MAKVFLALRTPGAGVDTTAVQNLVTQSEAVLSVPLRLEAMLLHAHAQIVPGRADPERTLRYLERLAIEGQYRVRRCQAIALIVYAAWRAERAVRIDQLERSVQMAEDAGLTLALSEGVRVLALCSPDAERSQRARTQLDALTERLGYTTLDLVLPGSLP